MAHVLGEIRKNPLLSLLVFVPLVLVGEHVWPEAHTLLFLLSILAIVPLAALLSQATKSSQSGRAMRSGGCSTPRWAI